MPTLQRGRTRIFYVTQGDGPPILFIHGIGVVGRAWTPQIAELKKEFSTLTLDNRGIGESLPCPDPIRIEEMAEDCAALIAEVGWDSAHVVGHSMGGVIAQQLALSHPGKVRSLSLLCTFASGRAAARPTPWVIWMSLRTHLGTRQMRQRAFLEMLLTQDEIASRGTAELTAEISPLIGRDLGDNPPIMMRQLRALGRHHAQHRLGELAQLPTLVLSAQGDPIARPSHGRQLADAIPGAHFEILKNASHGVVLTQAPLINSRLRDFIGGVERTRGSGRREPE